MFEVDIKSVNRCESPGQCSEGEGSPRGQFSSLAVFPMQLLINVYIGAINHPQLYFLTPIKKKAINFTAV